MLLRLVLAVAALLGLWLAVKWLSKAPPAKVKAALITGGLGLLVLIGVGLVVTGRLAGLFAVAAGLAPWIGRALRLHGLWRMVRGDRAGRGESGSSPRTGGDGAMTEAQAYEILGLSPGAGPDEIAEAYRRLMRANHPDAGGSTWIATRLNQARDILLR